MAQRHVWKKKSAKLSICDHCDTQKKTVRGARGGVTTEYLSKGKKEAVADVPPCVEKGAAKKRGRKIASRPAPSAEVAPYMRPTVTAEALIYDEATTASLLGLTMKQLAQEVASGRLKPLSFKRYSADDLYKYLGLIEDERDAADAARREGAASIVARRKAKTDAKEGTTDDAAPVSGDPLEGALTEGDAETPADLATSSV